MVVVTWWYGNRHAQILAGTNANADATKIVFAKMATELMVDLVQAILVQAIWFKHFWFKQLGSSNFGCTTTRRSRCRLTGYSATYQLLGQVTHVLLPLVVLVVVHRRSSLGATSVD